MPDSFRSSSYGRAESVRAALRGVVLADRGGGARLPSVRRFAELHGVSKSTVVEAYERLAAEGLVVSRPGSGFYAAARPAVPAAPLLERVPDRSIDPLWIMRQSLAQSTGSLVPGCGWLPEDWLPGEAVRRALRAIARDGGANVAGYSSPQGHGPMRQHLAMTLGRRGIACEPASITLTDSGSRALDLICRLLIEPGDTVLVDDPCYFNFRSLLQAQRARVVGVPMTPDGPDVEAFADLAARHAPRLYLTNATLHNPTGARLAPAVAHRLLRLAETHDMIVVEDDIFADFETEASARLAALDGLERVIHVGSYSKTLSAAVRCGFIAAAPARVEALTDLKLATGFGNDDVSAQLVHRMLVDGSYRRHVEQLRARLGTAMGHVAARLRKAGLAVWGQPRAGFFLWAMLPAGLDAGEVARRTLEEGVVLAPGNIFSVSQTAGRFLRFNVAQSDQPKVFDVLARAMR